MVGKVAGGLVHIGPVYLQPLGQSRKGQSLAEVVIIIIVLLGCLHYPEIVRFEALDHGVFVTDGDVHNEFG